MRFPRSMCVEWLEINSATWFPVLLCTNHHPMAPCDRFTDGDLFKHTQSNILVQSSLDILLPVELVERRDPPSDAWAGHPLEAGADDRMC